MSNESKNEARIGVVAIGAALCLAIASVGAIVYANVFVERAAVLPSGVAVNDLGLSQDQGENLRQYLQSYPGTNILNGDSDEENRKKTVSLDPILFKAAGGKWPFHGPQQTGDCSGFASAGNVEYELGNQVELGEADQWRPVSRQACYAQGRFNNGRKVISGSGSDPSLQVEAFQRDGVLWADYPDVPQYSKQSAVDWGNKGIPKTFLDRMGEFKVRDVQRCKTAQGVCNQIVDGKHPVFFGSFKFGTTKIKLLPNGMNVAIDNTSWPHAQQVVGYKYDDSTDEGYFRVMNSWGPAAHMPLSKVAGDRPGGYYIKWDVMDMICGEGMTFSISGIDGFEKREFPPDFHIFGSQPGEEKVMENAALQLTQASGSISVELSNAISLSGWVSLLVCAAILLVRIVGKRHNKSVGAAMLSGVLLLQQMPVHAEDKQPNAGGLIESNELHSGGPIVDFGILLQPAMQQKPVEMFPRNALHAAAAIKSEYHEDAFTLLRQHVEEQQTDSDKPSTSSQSSGYPLRSTWWSHPGARTQSNMVQHLQSGEHKNDFDANWLRTLSVEQLESLHSDAHEGRVNWRYAVKPGQKAVTQAEEILKPLTTKRTQKVWLCINGKCGWYDVAPSN